MRTLKRWGSFPIDSHRLVASAVQNLLPAMACETDTDGEHLDGMVPSK
jgi:hypothetical protein